MHIDFETYSEAGYEWSPELQKWRPLNPTKPGLSGVGAWIYSVHSSADIISLAYGGSMWVPGMPPPLSLFEYAKNGGVFWAWNSFFEFCIWANVAVQRYGWPIVPLDQFRCSMARARAWGLPGHLANAGAALSLDIQKDKAGANLIRKLSVPRNPTKHNALTRLTPESNPKDFADFWAYNAQDVKAEAAVDKVTPPLLPHEEKLWLLDQKINTRGVHVDRGALEDCIAIFHEAERKYLQELRDITDGTVETVNELQKMAGWMGAQGVLSHSLDADAVVALLERQDLPQNIRRVLEIRQILGSSSVKKLFSIKLYLADDDRIRGLFQYCGAERTGRFAGRGPQPQNMPSSGPPVVKCPQCGQVQWVGLGSWCRGCQAHVGEMPGTDWGIEAIEACLSDISTRNLPHVEQCWGDPLTAISGCLRGLFTAAPGHEFICSDYSSIEAVVLAVLAGEEWRIEVFRTHGKIYEMSAAKISGIPFEEFLRHKEETGQHHHLRKKLGKVAELASGYAGWIGAWKAFGADAFMDDQEIKRNILAWREASPMIVEFWGGQYRKVPGAWEFRPELFGLEGAAVSAVLNPGQCFSYRAITYGVKNGVLYCRLPSGRCLAYHQPQLVHTWDEMRNVWYYKLSFMGWNDNPKMGAQGWVRLETYGGKLTENVVQATARDILTHALPNLEDAGYPVVLHVHDEPCSEVPTGTGGVDEYERIMTTLPEWAAGWPIKASGGWRGRRYRK